MCPAGIEAGRLVQDDATLLQSVGVRQRPMGELQVLSCNVGFQLCKLLQRTQGRGHGRQRWHRIRSRRISVLWVQSVPFQAKPTEVQELQRAQPSMAAEDGGDWAFVDVGLVVEHGWQAQSARGEKRKRRGPTDASAAETKKR